MWVMTPYGFTSAVAHRRKKNHLLVRARDRQSLEAFCDFAGLSRDKIHMNMPSDYPFRVICKRQQYVDFLVASAGDIDYDNFKSRVGKVKDNAPTYLSFLHAVWSAGQKLTPYSIKQKNWEAWDAHDRKHGLGKYAPKGRGRFGSGGMWSSYWSPTKKRDDVDVVLEDEQKLPSLDEILEMTPEAREQALIDVEDAAWDGDADAEDLLREADRLVESRSGKSVHDMTEDEWRKMMEENPSGI